MLKKRNKYMKLLLAIALFLLFMGCETMVLEYKYVGQFKVDELEEENLKYLEISGYSLHSSLNVKNIKEIKEGNNIIIKVYLTIRKTNKTSDGNFTYRLKINDEINQVLFGEEQKVIWQRK